MNEIGNQPPASKPKLNRPIIIFLLAAGISIALTILLQVAKTPHYFGITYAGRTVDRVGGTVWNFTVQNNSDSTMILEYWIEDSSGSRWNANGLPLNGSGPTPIIYSGDSISCVVYESGFPETVLTAPWRIVAKNSRGLYSFNQLSLSIQARIGLGLPRFLRPGPVKGPIIDPDNPPPE